jgi:hypothetical protein
MPLRREFIALGVTAEVVMVVENQNFGVRAILLPKQVSSSQAANASPYDYQIICLIQQLKLVGALTLSR